MIPHWLWVVLGLSGTGPWYAWWSAFAGSAAMTVIFGSVMYWSHNVCHEGGCPRVGRHKVFGKSGSAYNACKRHHPHLTKGEAFHFKEHPDTAHLYAGDPDAQAA